MLRIKNGRLILPDELVCSDLYVENGVIAAVTKEPLPFDRELDAAGRYVSPGFIDLHTHGGGGIDFMDGGGDGLLEGAKTHFRHGATTIYPTSVACGADDLELFLNDVEYASAVSEKAPLPVPHIPGAHLEGPYFAPSQAGAQNPAYIKPPDSGEYESIIKRRGGVIKRWSFAPELDGARRFCEYLTANGIVPALAHSAAVYEEILPVYALGMRLVTHLYSGMTGVVRRNAYRRPGAVETAFLLDDMTVEVIADGRHLPPELLKLVYKIKGRDKIVLVSDSMRGAGMGSGPSVLGRLSDGMTCIIEDGVAKLPDRSAFAGSVATADILLRTMLDAGVPIVEAAGMMTVNPASVMNLSRKGRLEPERDADLVLFDDAVNVSAVIKMHAESDDGVLIFDV